MSQELTTRSYPREVMVSLTPPSPVDRIKPTTTIKFTDKDEYEEFERNVAVALNNHPANRGARHYIECAIESAYLKEHGVPIDTRMFAFTFSDDFIGHLSRGSNPKHRRATDSPISKPNTARKAGLCEVAAFDNSTNYGGGSNPRCVICSAAQGDSCNLSDEVIAQKIGAETNRRKRMGEDYYEAVNDARRLVRALIREELAKPASNNWTILFFALVGSALGEVVLRYFFTNY